MEELVRKAKRGDSSAFAELVRLCTQSMYRVAWTYLGNDEDAATPFRKLFWCVTKRLKP